ncbi:MAG: class I SAM-dependent methyltransferase [Actinobacteria bacterium]|nr:class I SAM-dependent methyltransferase [Actinomycetota bacterium]
MAEETQSSPSIGLNDAYSVKTPEDNRKLYAKWAATYESEFVDKAKYRYPRAIAEVFNDEVLVEDVANVVDVGTGTGLTGMYLTALRPTLTVDGIDISPEMLDQARGKRRQDGQLVYRLLLERDLTHEVLSINAPYDALISSGTFTHGHLGPEAIDNLIPLVRQGGWIVIGVNNEHFVARGFEDKLKELVTEAIISDLRVKRINVYEEGSDHRGDQARVLIFKRK